MFNEMRSSEITKTSRFIPAAGCVAFSASFGNEKPGNEVSMMGQRTIDSGGDRVIPEITYGDHKGNCQV
ncbi:MAG: hypothetical protein ACOC7Z_00070 [Candidatus Bipolaricaulota bacterium]